MHAHTRGTRGFSLIELMLVVAIVAILAAVGITQYQDQVSRARAAGAMSELAGFRHAIGECVALRSTSLGCSAGSHGIPALPTARTPNVIAWTSVADGVITAVSGATDASGGAALTIIDTVQTVHLARLSWTNTGTICHPRRGLKPGEGDCP